MDKFKSRKEPGKGSKPEGRRKNMISVYVDDDTMAQIKRISARERMNINETVNHLISSGLSEERF